MEAQTQTLSKTMWAVDQAHSEFVFKVRHMMISSVTGRFTNFEVNATTEGDGFENPQVDVKVDVNSISTNVEDRDNHLKSNDFFAADQFPFMTFTSKAYEGDTLVGDLTIRDITKEVTLNIQFNGIAQDPYGQTKAGFEITGDINRKDFNLTWDAITEAGNVVVADKIKLQIEVQLVKQ